MHVSTTTELPVRGWSEDVADMPDAWPYSTPSWAAGTTSVLSAQAKPIHAVATRAAGEHAWLLGYLFDEPAGVDWDPRTYLGWEAPDGAQVCCGVEASRSATEEVDSWGQDALFPCLVVGSPLGYRSEPAYNFWTRGLVDTLSTQLLEAADAAGAASVIAPWIPDRVGLGEMARAFEHAGGSTTFWGVEDYLTLGANSYHEHVSTLPRKRRQRVTHDQVQLARSGLTVQHMRGADLEPFVDRIADLVCLNREKNGTSQEPGQISGILRELLAADADLWGYLGVRGGLVVAASVAIRRRRRVHVKWAGFDYGIVGARSGLYFPFCFDMPMRDAYAEGVRSLEFGAGAHEAKALRGCESRQLTTAVLIGDEALRPRVAPLLAAFGARRRASFTAVSPRRSTTQLPLTGGDTCCEGSS
ncbi:MAG: hypothetical protein CSA84_06990 [Actinomycetales bacterium]|nr:MAG: hypothetical protein CSA84_06990 [Actinomycetales bacterium]